MNNPQNLKPNSARTPEERKELASKAGKASGEARREKRKIRETLQRLLNNTYTISNEEADTSVNLGGYDAIVTSLVNQAIKGDVKAFIAIRDTLGEKPTDVLSVESNDVSGIKIEFVDKSQPKKRQVDPKIVGDYTPPSNIEEY